jgi:hypothetical protein
LLELLSAHTVKQIIEAHLFRALYPLTSGIDLAVSLNRRDNRARSHVNVTSTLNDSLEGRTNIPLPLSEKANRMGMSVDTGAIR